MLCTYSAPWCILLQGYGQGNSNSGCAAKSLGTSAHQVFCRLAGIHPRLVLVARTHLFLVCEASHSSFVSSPSSGHPAAIPARTHALCLELLCQDGNMSLRVDDVWFLTPTIAASTKQFFAVF